MNFLSSVFLFLITEERHHKLKILYQYEFILKNAKNHMEFWLHGCLIVIIIINIILYDTIISFDVNPTFLLKFEFEVKIFI